MRRVPAGEEEAFESIGKDRFYISGPITGTKDYKRRFNRAEKELRAAGIVPVNPAKITASMDVQEFSHAEFMKVCMAALSLCNGIYLLKGYSQSIGAREELAYALENGMIVLTENEIGEKFTGIAYFR